MTDKDRFVLDVIKGCKTNDQLDVAEAWAKSVRGYYLYDKIEYAAQLTLLKNKVAAIEELSDFNMHSIHDIGMDVQNGLIPTVDELGKQLKDLKEKVSLNEASQVAIQIEKDLKNE